jgi:sarcosine oxidase
VQRFDVVVVGSGVMGAATARSLAMRGAQVAVLERFFVGHPYGSSHGRSRIFRLSYPDPYYVGLAQEAQELWKAASAESGEELIVTTGGFDIGEGIEANAAALTERDAPFEMLTPAEARRRFPQMSFPEDDDVLFQPDAGIALADRAVETFVASAVRHGAALFERTRALELDAGPGAAVHTESGTFLADVVVVTAGGWAQGLLDPIGIEIPTRVSRETVAFFAHEGPLPPTLVEWRPPHIYGLPSPGQGIKAGEHIAGPTVDPDERGGPDAESVARLAEWVKARFPEAETEAHHSETCLYTNTPDESFILERIGGFVVGSPCSGHGFKFAPAIGERLADLALG